MLRCRPCQTPRERVVVAMSGGVDSSVAAAWLIDAGYDVVGVTLHLWDYPDDGSVRGRCCAPEDQHDARRVADQLGIAHYAFDRRDLFRREVVDPFVDSYLSGSTPSPCVACNRSVKMGELFALADRLGAAKVATGHYARTITRGERVELHRGKDPSKDQSYFLHTLAEKQLARMVFPLGEATKSRSSARCRTARPPRGHQRREPRALLRADRALRHLRRRARGGIAFVLVRCSTPTGTRWAPTKGSTNLRLANAKGSESLSGHQRSSSASNRTGQRCASVALTICSHTGAVLSGARFFDDVVFPLVRRCKFATGTKGSPPPFIANQVGGRASSLSSRFAPWPRGRWRSSMTVIACLGGGLIERVLAGGHIANAMGVSA